MPFKVIRRNKKYQVVNADTGDVKGTHDTRASADAQLRALYANVPDARKDFQVTKSGPVYRWHGHPSVNVRDRDKELATGAALTEMVEREKSEGHYPPLQFFHIDYDCGDTDWYGVVDGILCASGTFKDDPVSQQIAKYHAEHPEGIDGSGWGMSWRFYSVADDRRNYEHIRHAKEFTFLPYSRAANQESEFEVEVHKAMLTPEQQKALELVLGDPALIAAAESAISAKHKSEALDAENVERKSADEPETRPVETETQKDAAVAAPAAGATQTVHGTDGVANQPGVEKADKCPKCGKPAHPGEPCPEPDGDEEKSAKVETVVEDLSDSVIKAIAMFTNEAIVTQRDELVKAINEPLMKITQVLADLQAKVAKLEGTEKAVVEKYEKPRHVLMFEKLKSASQDAASVIPADDPLAKDVPDATAEKQADDAEAGEQDVFRAAGFKSGRK